MQKSPLPPAMRKIGTYMNIVVWYCQHCDQVNDEV